MTTGLVPTQNTKFPFREEPNTQLAIGWQSEKSSEISQKPGFLCKSWQSETLGIQKMVK